MKISLTRGAGPSRSTADAGPATAPGKKRRINGRIRVGLTTTGVIVLVALFGPLVAPHDPATITGSPYSSTGLLGTDSLGRDVLSRLLCGGRSLVWMSLAATVLCIFVGTVVGLSAAYSRGRLDAALMRGMDILLALPSIVLVLLFVSMLGTRPWLLVVLVAVSQVPSIARVMRGAATPVVERDFVLWGRAAGMRTWTILRREVLPNVVSPLLVEFGLRLMWCISLLAGLSYLGYGLQPPAADWGLMVNENKNALAIQPWAVVAPIIAIGIFTIGGNLFAEGVARTFNRTEGTR